MGVNATRGANITAGVIIALIFVGPIGGLALAVWSLSQPTSLDAKTSAVYMQPTLESFADEQSVTVAVSWAEGVAVLAPAWDGVVTEVAVRPGDTIVNGSNIVRIDGIWRIAASTPSPLFRPVSSDSSSDEIAAVTALLRSLGYRSSSKWSWETVAGIRAFAKDRGVPGHATVEAFEPSWVVWLPAGSLTLSEVGLAPGQSAPSLGEQIAQGTGHISALDVTSTDGIPLPDPAEATWELRSGDASAAYLGPRMSGVDDVADFSARFADTKPEELTGVVRRVEAIEAWSVPSSALFVDADGTTCVFVRGASEGDPAPRTVTVAGAAVGQARITAGLWPEDAVLVNPGDIVGDAQCD
ncbi:hypothetical protein ACI3KX_09860 [Microbacterium sp. ZW CA_36]|uniref:hypothetical protein n=1 Tax=Microbacterium sp. ZW CA_36 TaxID=3378078 RepID=UPI0038525905